MSDYISRKFPTAASFTNAVEYEVQASIQKQGWELPCVVTAVSADGLFVTVNIAVNALSFVFKNITIPIYQPQYIRAPIQVGDRGVTKKIDVSLYPITGPAKGQAGYLSDPNFGDGGNYEALLGFIPVSSKATYPATSDASQTWIYGVDGHGVKITNKATSPQSTVTINNTGIRLQAGSAYIQINADGTIDIHGTLSINEKAYMAHEHSGVQAGSSNSGGVINP